MPRSRAGHLRRVIWNNYTLEAIPLEYCQNSHHVDVAFIDKRFMVVWDLPFDISQVHVGYLALAAISVDRVIYVSLCHLCKSPDAQFQGVVAARHQINHFLIHRRLIDEARLTTHGRHWGIVGVKRQTHASLFRHGNDLFQELSESTPQFAVRDGGENATPSSFLDTMPHSPFRTGTS